MKKAGHSPPFSILRTDYSPPPPTVGLGSLSAAFSDVVLAKQEDTLPRTRPMPLMARPCGSASAGNRSNMPATKKRSRVSAESGPNMNPITPQDAIQTPIKAVTAAIRISNEFPCQSNDGDRTNTNGMTHAIQPSRTAVMPVSIGLAPDNDAAANAAVNRWRDHRTSGRSRVRTCAPR